MLFSVLGGLFLLSTNDFISFYLALEIMTIPLYVLVASNYKSNFSTEAGLKYFIVGSFSSGLVLFGFSFIYGFSGISNFDDLELFLMSFYFTNCLVDIGLIVGVIFFCVGLLIKIGVAPFHF
jgi:NADH:ubiquinone oxidoreductase subunit 2 (subunit N)